MIQNSYIDTDRKYVKMKKEVYEHLAKTFLDKKSKKVFKKNELWLYLNLAILAFILLFFLFGTLVFKKNVFAKNIFVMQDHMPLEIDYDFIALGDSKTKKISFDLQKLNLSGYKSLSLALRTKLKTKIDSSIRIQIENSLSEVDSEYVRGIRDRWITFSLPLSGFEKINNWDSIRSLSFLVEEWNIDSKKDSIFVDDVKFVAN
jgi:hypothetical protein